MEVLQWIYALKAPTEVDPVLIICDGHITRYNCTAVQWAMTHHIHLFILPPNATAILQPLDLVIFSVFKLRMAAELQKMAKV